MQTYEDTLLALWAHAESQGLPYTSLQLDSWWYYKVIA